MKAGDSINIKATVLRVNGVSIDAQTPTGQLIQTDVSNVAEHKAILKPAENKTPGKKAKK